MTLRRQRGKSYRPLLHLAAAAWRAIRLRASAESFPARAFPPFNPPLRLAAVVGLAGPLGESFGRSPVVMSTISFASWLRSRGRFGRVAMLRVCHTDGLPEPQRTASQISN